MANTPFLLNLLTKAVSYGDSLPNSNPMRRAFDWSRSYTGISVSNPITIPLSIPTGGSLLAFSGVRSTTVGGGTTFTVTLSPLGVSQYRFTASAGVLRTDRSLALHTASRNITVASLPNSSATWTLNAGTWAGVVAGDTLFIPGPVTGDAASPFNPLNQGYWQVLSNVGTVLTVSRFPGSVFSAASESVLAAAYTDAQVVAYSAAGVLPGDNVTLSAGFSLGTLATYSVMNVTSTFFEVISTLPLALDVAAVPGVSGIVFYTNAKSFILVEADQRVVVQLNGSSDATLPVIAPLVAGDPENVGYMMLMGPVYSLTVVNKSLSTANVLVLGAS